MPISHAENLPASQNAVAPAIEVTNRDATQTKSEMIDGGDQALSKLLRYCRSESWIGYDPYDGLKSPVARSFFFNNRLARTALTQLIKRSPVNLRPILGIKKAINPKGAAVSARAIMMLADREGVLCPAK